MKPGNPSILILLGGMYHDFDAFALSMQVLFQAAGYTVGSTYDLDALTRLDRSAVDLILSYTCFSEPRPGMGDPGPAGLTAGQVAGLVDWVRAGGALLGVHAATVIGSSDPSLGRLLGGVFLSHPEPFSFTVYPLSVQHPIAAGVPAFEVRDEFYLQECDPSVQVHMAAVYQEVVHPMVWSRLEAQGRVAVVAPGHFPAVWAQPAYRQLLLQSASWLLA